MGLKAMQCKNCGGTVAMHAGEDIPRCLFCDSETLIDMGAEDIEQPRHWLPFVLDADGATGVFRAAATASWFYPSVLKTAVANVHPVLVPAWVWMGDIESHFAALVRAPTRSGKKPLTGAETLPCHNLLVLSGSRLTRAELDALAPFAFDASAVFDAEKAGVPFELSRLTRSVARAQAKAAMSAQHRAQLTARLSPNELNISSIYHTMEGFPVLLPVYVGSFRYKDTPRRFVINGQTGEYVGKIPVSIGKILIVVAAGLAVASGIAVWLAW